MDKESLQLDGFLLIETGRFLTFIPHGALKGLSSRHPGIRDNTAVNVW